MKIKTVFFVCITLALAFVVLGGLNFGYSLKSSALLAATGIFFGLVAAPEVSPKDFKHPTIWQVCFCALGFLVAAYLLSSPPIGYFLAILLGIVAGYTAPSWVKHIAVP